MNSYSDDILRSILELLPPPDLARAACVCRSWRAIASDREIQEHAFKKPWNLKKVVGTPISNGFWRVPNLHRFAISHKLNKGDTVASLALRYSVQLMKWLYWNHQSTCLRKIIWPLNVCKVMDIKRLNNMMSEHGIYSRERLLIPISSSKSNILSNSTCFIEMDAHAKREVAVLYLDENGLPEIPIASLALNTAVERRGRRMVVESVKRSMHVDEGTAEYYLSISDGDPRAAIMQMSEDLTWEQQRAP